MKYFSYANVCNPGIYFMVFSHNFDILCFNYIRCFLTYADVLKLLVSQTCVIVY